MYPSRCWRGRPGEAIDVLASPAKTFGEKAVPQTSALLLALTASHFSRSGSMVGLEYWLQFRKAVRADEEIELEWLIIRVRPHARFGGIIVDLRGRVPNSVGEMAPAAKGRVVVSEKL